MTCEQAFKLIDAHLDRELDAPPTAKSRSTWKLRTMQRRGRFDPRAANRAQSEAIHFGASDTFRSRLKAR